MDPVTAQSVVKVVAAALILLVAVRLILLGPPGRRLGPARKQIIKVVGVGGGGGNAVNAMVRSGIRGVEFVAINTDRQALRESVARRRIQIGSAMTEGLGSGGDPTVGKRAAEDDIELITQALEGSDMVFITAGLGGGTGSGAASIVAGIARQQGALTIGVVTKPFAFEGPGRNNIADAAGQAMRANVDALITVRNDRVRNRVPETATVSDAFDAIDEVLRQSVQGILDVIGIAGRVNLDFADVRALLKDGGPTVMGVGRAAGDKRVVMATHRAVSSGLLENTIDGATRIMLNVAGSANIALSEVTAAAEELRAAADKDVNLTFGASFDPSLDEEVVVTVIATGMTAGRQVVPARTTTAGKRMVAQRPARAARRIPVTGQARRPRTGRPKVTPPQAAQMASVAPVASVARPVKAAAAAPPKNRAERPTRVRPARTSGAPATPAPRRRAPKRVAALPQATLTAATMGEDEYDAPTFLRKPIDGIKAPETPRSAS
ncbi:MAG: cell division protein FtsZ [Chloroflexota bacterium]|nr:cell division protein FtsZ [Chloroflexota bacterium]